MSKDWLSKIRQGTHINYLAIPGTHDAASISGKFSLSIKGTSVPTMPLTFTQQIDIEGQLDSGVRVLDMRVAYAKPPGAKLESIYMCHGPVIFSTKLSEQLNLIRTWLRDNPTEFVAMIFQQQGVKSTDPIERKRVTDLIMKRITDVFSDEWIYHPKDGAKKWPTVGQLKKKVMVFSRLEDPVHGTFDLREWNTKSLTEIINAQFDIDGTGLKVAVQDRYTEVTNTDFTDFLNNGWLRDVGEINEAKFILFDRLRSQFNESYTLKINHLSHSLKDPIYSQPYMLGTDLNERLKNSLENRDTRYRGFVMIDDAEASVCKSIVDSNIIFQKDCRPRIVHKSRRR